MSSCEVQRQHFEQFIRDSGYHWIPPAHYHHDNTPESLKCPVVGVSWYDCAAYCNWLSRREGLEECYEPNSDGMYGPGMTVKPNLYKLTGYRLPTGSEWETAGRAGTRTPLNFGDCIFALQNYAWDMTGAGGGCRPVAQLRPNSYGLYDIHGNACEWTLDVPEHLGVEPATSSSRRRELRGGGIMSGKTTSLYFSTQDVAAENATSLHYGMRIVRSLPSTN